MKYTKEQLEMARANTSIKADCPSWMQELFESAPKNKKFWFRTRTKEWWYCVSINTWSGGIYRIAMNWNGE
jgi:hypothetical protein